MHPDQKTPDSHRYQAPDSATSGADALGTRTPEQDQNDPAIPSDEASDEPGSAPPVEGGRSAEAGNAYTGRGMDDALKANPRVDEPGAGTARTDD